MKKIILFAIAGIFMLGISARAATCEIKAVCVDNNHVGYQGADCKITSADDIAKAMGGGEGTYSCYVGCKDGDCIADNSPYTCNDTDGGKDYFVKGSVAVKGNGEQGASADYCVDKDNLSEMGCAKDYTGKYSISVNSYKCPNGCANGVCIKTASGGTGSICADSDGGKDIFKAGIITINGQAQDISDTCGFEPQTITEKYCLPNGTYGSEDMKCPGLCEILPDTYGHAYCTTDCAKSRGYYCHKTPDGKYGIAFLTKDCQWQKITPCQSNGCSTGLCMTVGNLIDTDGDGLLDVNEVKWGTDPNKFDTDGDGFGDMTEIYGGYNPTGDGKFTPAQLILAGQMVPIADAPISNTDNNNLVATPTADVINSTTAGIVTAPEIGLINSTSSFNALANSIFSDFGRYIIAIIAIIFLLFYIYCALCLQLIAKKLGFAGLWMAWVPIANIFLILKCAGRPYWWFLLMFIPIANIIVALIPWMDIAEKLGKSKWLGLLMIVAPLNLILMGYLAFSRLPSINNQDNYIQPAS